MAKDVLPMPGQAEGMDLLARLRPYVRHCGAKPRQAWRLGRRCLLDHLLVSIAEGRGRFTIGDTTWEASPGDLFWIPPNVPHEMEGYAPGMLCPYVHFDLVYRPEVAHWDFSIPPGMTDLGELAPLLPPPLAHPLVDRLPGRLRLWNHGRIDGLIRDLCAEAQRAQPFTGLMLSGTMLMILAEILRGVGGLTDMHHHLVPAIEAAAAELRDRCQHPPGLALLARRHGMSASHFRKLFQKHLGCPPREHLRRVRIALAKRLMLEDALDLATIAERCGFANLHCLSRAFRSLEGIPPSVYRSRGVATIQVEGRKSVYPR